MNLTRLEDENETLQEYLTWLFSEALAARTRKLALPKLIGVSIPATTIGFSGQFTQGQILFDLYSEIVFAPPADKSKPIRFGELIRNSDSPETYLLVLTPACDLQRCSSTKTLLCAIANGKPFNSPKELSQNKLFGKLSNGALRHLFSSEGANNTKTRTQLNWNTGEVATYTVQALMSAPFERLSIMNELFAQEVKEEVLRSVGRIGTQIDPPPPQALSAQLSWRIPNGQLIKREIPEDRFTAALMTFAGTDKPTVVLSEEFKIWTRIEIAASCDLASAEKLNECLNYIDTEQQFSLSGKTYRHQDKGLVIRLLETDENGTDENQARIVVTLLTDEKLD